MLGMNFILGAFDASPILVKFPITRGTFGWADDDAFPGPLEVPGPVFGLEFGLSAILEGAEAKSRSHHK
jgi:hypothetical protein